jgi:hypothetical protein
MSKPKDPRDVMIDYILNQPIERATDLLHTLTAIVKARARRMGTQPAQPPARAQTSRARTAPPRTVTEVDPASLLHDTEERTARPQKSRTANSDDRVTVPSN